jgi:hypothetical protein
MHPCWRVCGKNFNIVSMCVASPVVHTSNIPSCQKKSFSFPVAVNNSFDFFVINVCNHGEHYETPCIFISSYQSLFAILYCLTSSHNQSYALVKRWSKHRRTRFRCWSWILGVFFSLEQFYFGQDSAVGIVTRCGLDGPGIESRLGQGFPHPSGPALGPTQSPIQRIPGVSRG